MSQPISPELRAELNAVIEKYRGAGPQTGIFTDGGATPNPGPGGWGLVYVRDGSIVNEKFGCDPDTTNNRMEYTALIEALTLVSANEAIDIYTDSELVVRSMNEWAINWERRGWKKKDGAIKNLDLVQRAFALKKERPNVQPQWIRGHNGWVWNEYADVLSNASARVQMMK